jgi:hypothetical protein
MASQTDKDSKKWDDMAHWYTQNIASYTSKIYHDIVPYLNLSTG